MKVVGLIVAMNEDGVIGQDNRIPWYYGGDLKRFRELTINHTVIMGRKTYESIGRALPERMNYVVSRDDKWRHPDDVTSFCNLRTAISRAPTQKVWIIGGAGVYEDVLKWRAVDFCDVTMVPDKPEGRKLTVFPISTLEKYYVISEKRRHKYEPSLEVLRYVKK